MKIIFFGTPEFAKHFLAALHEDADISVEAVITQPDKPTGRKQTLTPSPVKIYSAENKIPVYQPDRKSKILPMVQEISEGIDAFVVVAYGNILAQEVLDLPKLGTINVHPSKLPQYRGPSPMQAALVNQDKETAISIMLLDAEMDHGPIFAQLPIALAAKETLASLQNKVIEQGGPFLVETLKDLQNDLVYPIEQDHNRATYCGMLSREDGRIDWNESAAQIEAKFRAYYPWPGLWTMWNDKRVKFASLTAEPGTQEPGSVQVQNDKITIGTGDGLIVSETLQLEGQQNASVSDTVKGRPDLHKGHFN